jgi:acyl dehydratase
VQFGRSYEEFEVGATYKHWPGKTVTEYDDHLFCLLTMNHHPLHLDAHYAEQTDFDGDTLYGETTVLDKWESTSKDDRGVVHVETIGYNQDGKIVCIFRRKVMVPRNSYLEDRGGEQPGRPVPQPDKNWPGRGEA